MRNKHHFLVDENFAFIFKSVNLFYHAIFCWVLKIKVINFLSSSVTDIVLENTEFSKKWIFLSCSVFSTVTLSILLVAAVPRCSDGPGSVCTVWPFCCQSPARTQCVSDSPWHQTAFNVQEFLAYSFSSGSSVSSFVSSGPEEVQAGPQDITPNVIFSSKRSADSWHPRWVCFLLLSFSHVYCPSE